MAAIGDVLVKEVLVQFLQAVHLGHGHKKISPGKPNKAFNTAFFMALSWIAEPGLKGVIGPKFIELVLFNPLLAFKDFLDCCG